MFPSLGEFQARETRTDNATACKTLEAELGEGRKSDTSPRLLPNSSLQVELGRAAWFCKASSRRQNRNPASCSSTAHSITQEHLCRILSEGGTQSPSAAGCHASSLAGRAQLSPHSLLQQNLFMCLQLLCAFAMGIQAEAPSVPSKKQPRRTGSAQPGRHGAAGRRAPGNGPAGAASRIPSLRSASPTSCLQPSAGGRECQSRVVIFPS